MARSFNVGHQSEALYNQQLHELFKIMEHLPSMPSDPTVGPVTDKEGALWLDRQNGGDLKYFESGVWQLLFGNRFKMISEILSPTTPQSPVTGQLWLSDGVMMYYNGIEWLPIKAVNVDTKFSLSSFEQFLIINPLPISGDLVVDNTSGSSILKSQFLMPSVEIDKFFVNGVYTDDYEVVSNVAVQYPTEQLQGKTASAVHINPMKLTGITKRLVHINKTNPVIPVPELNTEYYAFKDGVGKLLLKSGDTQTEYSSVTAGVQLTPAVANMYDFVLAITYRFGNVKHQGQLHKGKVTLSGTNSVYIGHLTDPICVFVDGLYLHDHGSNYTYDPDTGYLNFTLETKMNVAVIAFPKKEIGTIAATTTSSAWGGETEVGIIQLNGAYNKPLVFVSGETLELGLADYEFDSVTNKMYVKDAKVGMNYAIVEAMGATYDSDMFVKSGIVPNGDSVNIPCTLEELPGDISPLLFVDGIIVSQRDIIRNTDNSLTAYGLTAGQQYVLLKDPENRLVFDDMVSFTTLPTPVIDDALVYVENHLLCDSAAVYVSKLPKTAVDGEIKLLLQSDGTELWHKYNITTSTWEPIEPVDQEGIDTINNLNNTAMGYANSNKTISILQNFGPKDCVYYAYTFANSIEEPLLRGNIKTNNTDTQYKVNFKHPYPRGVNALSVWLDGIRQYHINESSTTTFELPEAIEGNCLYVIEKPESGEVKSCERNILTPNERIPGTANTYRTTTPLYPGNVRIFINGYRQPPTAYRILDPYTIMFKDPLLGGFDNYPIETIERDGKSIDITRTIPDNILLEVRQDFNLKEITLPIKYPSQREWTVQEDGLPKEILESKDFIMAYINGSAYGREYTIDKDKEAIILNNISVTNDLGLDPIFQHFKNNPDKYLEWQIENNYANYEPRAIKDTITFEWR